ncbi:MAG: O-methyltransferase [Bacteroidota bacterium]
MKLFPIFFRFIRHLLHARSRYGHGIHSPFLFAFVSEVTGNAGKRALPAGVGEMIRRVRKDRTLLETPPIGAGSKVSAKPFRQVGQMARKSSVGPRWGALLYRLVAFYKPSAVVELGTGLGISTACLAAGGTMPLVTVEANSGKCAYAEKLMQELGFAHVKVIRGTFGDMLPELVAAAGEKTLYYIDGNHTREATLQYAGMILEKSPGEKILVLDDINWSEGMNEAWTILKNDPAVTVSVDLFQMGLLIVRDGMQKAAVNLFF